MSHHMIIPENHEKKGTVPKLPLILPTVNKICQQYY